MCRTIRNSVCGTYTAVNFIYENKSYVKTKQ